MIAAAVYGVARGAGCALGRLLLVAFPARSAPVRRAESAAGQSCRGERVGKPAPPAGRRDDAALMRESAAWIAHTIMDDPSGEPWTMTRMLLAELHSRADELDPQPQ